MSDHTHFISLSTCVSINLTFSRRIFHTLKLPLHPSQSRSYLNFEGGAVHAPGALRRGSPPPTHKWKHHAPRWPSTLPRSGYARARVEALCSALVINNWGGNTAALTSGSPRAQWLASPCCSQSGR